MGAKDSKASFLSYDDAVKRGKCYNNYIYLKKYNINLIRHFIFFSIK